MYNCTCIRGKVIGSVVVIIIAMDTEITKSGDLGTLASCKYNESVELGQKLHGFRMLII